MLNNKNNRLNQTDRTQNCTTYLIFSRFILQEALMVSRVEVRNKNNVYLVTAAYISSNKLPYCTYFHFNFPSIKLQTDGKKSSLFTLIHCKAQPADNFFCLVIARRNLYEATDSTNAKRAHKVGEGG